MIRHLLKLVWNRKRANALIAVEIFFSFLVVFAVLTALVTFVGGWREPLGFEWQNVLNVSMQIEASSREKAPKELHERVMAMIAEAEAMPEVEAAAMAMTPPYTFSTASNSRSWRNREVSYLFDEVTDGYFEAMQLKLLRGRWFSREDDAAPEQPVVLDAPAARLFFGDENPVGQKIEGEGEVLKVVGVVAAFRKDGETSAPSSTMFRRYAPNAAYGRIGSDLVIRVRPGTPAAFEQKLAARLQQIAPDIPLSIRPMEQLRNRMSRMRLAPLVVASIVGLFLIAMVALGLIGVLWQTVTRRTREIGLRRALGASGSGVRRQVLGEVALLATIALTLGVVIVLQLPILGVFSLVTPSAFTTGLVAAVAAIYLLTVLCGLYPSWLASRLEPADALRYE
ncbi:MAG TPA: ABC transporter permease [Thermoanaerobaculia bacterium]|nr:ABC transporter permease [Thermoanaerobaculia bacterium]